MILNDETYESLLSEEKPVLLLCYGNDLRGEMNTAFNQASDKHPDVVFARIALADNPKAMAHFQVGTKSTLIGLFQGDMIFQRSRPWGTDVPLGLDMLRERLRERVSTTPVSTHSEPIQGVKEQKPMDTKPVIVTDANFQAEVIDYELPVLVDFWAEWCGPCRMVGPILEKMAEEYAGKVRIAKVNVDENPGLSQYFQIMSIPTLMMLKQQTIVFNQPGALPEAAVRNLIDQLITLELPPRDEQDHDHDHEHAHEEEADEQPAE